MFLGCGNLTGSDVLGVIGVATMLEVNIVGSSFLLRFRSCLPSTNLQKILRGLDWTGSYPEFLEDGDESFANRVELLCILLMLCATNDV